ncbi:hypothetical protein VTO73DRAFT_4018 [Trametes versicolor]
MVGLAAQPVDTICTPPLGFPVPTLSARTHTVPAAHRKVALSTVAIQAAAEAPTNVHTVAVSGVPSTAHAAVDAAVCTAWLSLRVVNPVRGERPRRLCGSQSALEDMGARAGKKRAAHKWYVASRTTFVDRKNPTQVLVCANERACRYTSRLGEAECSRCRHYQVGGHRAFWVAGTGTHCVWRQIDGPGALKVRTETGCTSESVHIPIWAGRTRYGRTYLCGRAIEQQRCTESAAVPVRQEH